MSSATKSQIDRLSKEISNLRKNDAQEAKKEADLQVKVNRANEAANRSKNASTRQSKIKEMERASQELVRVQKKRGDLSGKIADKVKSLRSYEGREFREDEKVRKKIADDQKRLIREREAHERQLASGMRSRAAQVPTGNVDAPQPAHDFFISHASEDKDAFVRELAEALRSKGANVWYDEFTLRVGDSLRRNIDRGLANSRFGVVVFSEHFFGKEWPNRELDGLVVLEMQGQTRILPIWHKVSKDEVARYSPTLADKVALNTSLKGVNEIADELMSLIGDPTSAA